MGREEGHTLHNERIRYDEIQVCVRYNSKLTMQSLIDVMERSSIEVYFQVEEYAPQQLLPYV